MGNWDIMARVWNAIVGFIINAIIVGLILLLFGAAIELVSYVV